jgi:hypothetical protein
MASLDILLLEQAKVNMARYLCGTKETREHNV